MTKEQLIEALETIRNDVINETNFHKQVEKIKSYAIVAAFVEVLLDKYYNYKYKAKMIMEDEELKETTHEIIKMLKECERFEKYGK